MEPSPARTDAARVERLVATLAEDLRGPLSIALVVPPVFALVATMFVPSFAPGEDVLDANEAASVVTLWQLAGNPGDVDGSGPATAVAKIVIVVLVAAVAAALGMLGAQQRRTAVRLSYVAEVVALVGALGLVIVAVFAGANDVGVLSGLGYGGRPVLWLGVLAAIWCAASAHVWRRVSDR